MQLAYNNELYIYKNKETGKIKSKHRKESKSDEKIVGDANNLNRD